MKRTNRLCKAAGCRLQGVDMRILFYGDSNTYGYDPAGYMEMRYPQHQRWTYLLQQMDPGKWEILPEGMNGRTIPDLRYDAARIHRMIRSLKQEDLFAVMLGTNDILLTMDPDADPAIEKMRAFLAFLTEERQPSGILVIAPPHIGRSGVRDPLYQRYYRESKRMNAGFEKLADDFGVHFADAGSWDIDLSADLVHLSEKGHSQFAERMGEYLQSILSADKDSEDGT